MGDNLENSVAPPQASPPDRVGFVNIYDDRKITDGADDSVRRYVLSRSPNPLAKTAYCKTNYSFAWQLVYRYFQSKNIPVTTSGKNWQFGSQVINRLVNPNWIRDRIVIVGVTAKSVKLFALKDNPVGARSPRPSMRSLLHANRDKKWKTSHFR